MKFALIALTALIMSWEPSCDPADYSSSNDSGENHFPYDPGFGDHRNTLTVINGFVLDSASGEGIDGAYIRARESGVRVRSSRNGYYRIEGLPMGNHTVVVEASDYSTDSLTILLDSLTYYQYVNFKLQPCVDE